MTSIPPESWTSYVSKKKDVRKDVMDGTIESTIKALDSFSDQVSDPLEPKLAWMSSDASKIIRREMSKENSPCVSMAGEASIIVNHYLKREEINKTHKDILDISDHEHNHNSQKSKIVPLIASSDLLDSAENNSFTKPRIKVSMCDLLEPSLATTWLPGLSVSTQYEQLNEPLQHSTSQCCHAKISEGDDIQIINVEDLKDDLYNLMTQTITEGRLVTSFPRRLQNNREKLMNCSAQTWCFLLPSASLFQISTEKIASSCEPMREIVAGLSVFISALGTLCPSQNCGQHLVSVLLPIVLQSISTLNSKLVSKHCYDYSEICIKISNDIIYKYNLGAEKKSNLLKLLEGIKSSKLEFALCLWLDISRVYYECNR
jgi:hypothetical protein